MFVNYLRRTNRISEERYDKLKHLLIPAGLFSLAVSLVLSRFFAEYEMADFFAGFFIGISIVANIAGLIFMSRIWKKK